MNKTQIMATVSGKMSRVVFSLKKHSPEILVVAGITGTVASAVMACKATTKIDTILDETERSVNTVHHYMKDPAMIESGRYSEEDGKKDLAIIYTQTAVKMIKLYAPSVALGALSLTCILASNSILKKRNVALAAAYATIDKGFKEYRSRVVERFGETVDHEIRHNIKAQTFEETVTDENGKTKNVKTKVDIAENPNTYSDYARFFDEASSYWEKNAEYNLMFLRAQQQYANDKLRANGRLFLNEVYDMLDIPRTKAGQVVGWIYDDKNPTGDNYVDFGIYDTNRAVTRDFVNGYERVILLDFNVDGNVWDNM